MRVYQAQWRSQLPAQPETWTTNDLLKLSSLAFEHPIACDIALKSEVRDGKQYLDQYNLRRWFLGSNASWSLEWLTTTIRLSSRLGMSDRRTVMLDANSNDITGTLFYVPIHNPEFNDLLTVQRDKNTWLSYARWLYLKSLIVAPVDFKVLVQSIWDGAPADLGIEIFSSTNRTAETWMNASQDGPHAADPEFKAYLTHRQRWPMYGLRFSIFFYTTPLFEAQSPRRLAKVAMAAGAALTLLATALVGVLLRARNRQELLIDQIREARDALAAAQQEREQFSRDLHDGTIQSLYAIQLGLDHMVEKLKTGRADDRRALAAVRQELDAVIAEIRQFITAEAAEDKPVEFSAVLDALAQRSRTGTNAQIALRCDPGASERLTLDQAVQLANIAREALSNSLRHANPKRVEIALGLDGETVVLEIADNGSGFDSKAPGRSGVGLTSMKTRTQEMGGTMDLQSAPGEGTRVVVRVPASPLERAGSE